MLTGRADGARDRNSTPLGLALAKHQAARAAASAASTLNHPRDSSCRNFLPRRSPAMAVHEPGALASTPDYERLAAEQQALAGGLQERDALNSRLLDLTGLRHSLTHSQAELEQQRLEREAHEVGPRGGAPACHRLSTTRALS